MLEDPPSVQHEPATAVYDAGIDNNHQPTDDTERGLDFGDFYIEPVNWAALIDLDSDRANSVPNPHDEIAVEADAQQGNTHLLEWRSHNVHNDELEDEAKEGIHDKEEGDEEDEDVEKEKANEEEDGRDEES